MSAPKIKFDLQIKYGTEYGPEEEQALLQVLRQGARPEERSIARNRVSQAEAAFRKADADLARRKKLEGEG